LAYAGHTIKLPQEKSKKLLDAGYANREVVLGVRPEDLHDDAAFVDSHPESVVEPTVVVTEILGAEILLYLALGTDNLIARADPNSQAKGGEVVKIALDASRIHVFDKETEKIITN